MTYRPSEEFFGPPFVQKVPGLVHLFFAALVVALVFGVKHGAQNSELYRYMYQQKHLIEAPVVAAAFVVSALASLLRAGMRGVRVRGDWVEYRDVIASVWPKVRRIRWAQIDQVNIEPSGSVSLDLWDGTKEWLPAVGQPRSLAHVLERVARARAIPLSGGSGLDDLDDEPLSDPVGD